MARTELTRRLVALEGATKARALGPCLWGVRQEDETIEHTIARITGEHGIGSRPVLVWQAVKDTSA